jgi:hypothetical protein
MHDLYARTNIITGMKSEKDEMGGKCGTHGRKDEAHTGVVVTTPEGKRAF